MSSKARSGKSPGPDRVTSSRAGTDQQLLEVAGEIFADKGFHGATGQEICQRAGVNAASINYYFGGMDGLYEAVILKALSLCATPETVPADEEESYDPRELLRQFVAPLISTLTGPSPGSWIIRLLIREFISPSPAAERLLFDAQAIPQAQRLKMIVAKIMDLPTDHPAVAHGCICVLAPMQIMIIGQPTLFDRLYPEMDIASASSEDLEMRALEFALGGLEALASVAKKCPIPTANRESIRELRSSNAGC